ncbi:transposase [Streptosporangium sp. NPDC006013]|uniref:RNA-guided endonuclease InsQ/TnpB family protein n=1 Tax=Streptosporangium sp. NPDC006013 TaxID=3155596 RepID=UPI0033BBE82C
MHPGRRRSRPPHGRTTTRRRGSRGAGRLLHCPAHKLSTTLTRDNQALYLEDLAVSALVRTRPARSVHDAGWSRFVGMLDYKARRYGRYFGKIDRWFPSPRLCSSCGSVATSMPLDVRSWACPCGAVHDRDVNAAINILAAGQADRPNDCGAWVRPGPVPASCEEAVTHPRSRTTWQAGIEASRAHLQRHARHLGGGRFDPGPA